MNPSKKLRSAEPDLQVEVGPEKKVYEYHSVIFASFSPYVDSMLAAPMKESASKRISFPEISPEVWEKMIKFLQEGVDDMTFEDAEQVIPLYDKYQFDSGVELVNKFLEKEVANDELVIWMKDTADLWINRSGNYLVRAHPMDWFIKRLDLSDQYNLEETREACIESLELVLNDKKARLVIFVHHWAALASLVAEDRRLWKPVADVLLKVGEADTMKFVNSSKEGDSGVFFKLLRALLELEYAMEQGVALPS